jgi:2-oxoglutarate dehydrogenase E2 component (dihydrolipoamide succinyltransferase)
MSLIELKVPTIGESVTEVTLSKWLKPDGAIIALDEPICEFESDKATLEFPSEAAGKLIHVAKEGADLSIGALIARIDTSIKTSSESVPEQSVEIVATPKESVKPKEVSIQSGSVHHPSPVAARIIAESDLKMEEIAGTGRDGKITKADALDALARKHEHKNEFFQETRTESVKETSGRNERSSHREKLSRMRKTIARRLVAAKNETAMLTTFNEVDMSAIMELRNKYNEAYLAKYGIKIGFMSLFAKACSAVLMDMPQVNAQLEGDDLIFHHYVDIAIAISTANGLVVPPIRNVESIKIHEFEHQLKLLADKARNGKLSMEEMTGGTFTITNGGVFGSLLSTPIINEPQSAILGMHSIKDRPVALNGQVVIRPMMYIALSYDHRVIDGSSSVSFLVKVKEILEDPMKFFLEL